MWGRLESQGFVLLFLKKSFVDFFFSIWVNYLLFPFSVEQDPGLDIGVK